MKPIVRIPAASEAPGKRKWRHCPALPNPQQPNHRTATLLGRELKELTSEIRYQSPSLQGGAISSNARVAESLFQRPTGEGRESVIAAFFWLSRPARRLEGDARQEHVGQRKGRNHVSSRRDL